ncbi:MAG TPA: di-heme oxidoredictase family protein [Gemmatimonadaceae bacterium]|nr:di-heme oxidoredictase family protein [Gemmatimonadaceae bacterium]
MYRAPLTIALLFALVGCDDLLTEAPDAGDIFDGPVEGLSADEMAAFVRGDTEFGRRFAPASGLGPLFNNVSCASCHSGDGRGRLENALHRIGTAGDGYLGSLGGPQIQDKAIAGAHAEAIPTGVAVSVRLPPPVFGVGLIEAIPEAAILANADSADRNGDGISGRPNWVYAAEYVPGSTPGAGAALRVGRFGRKAQTSNLVEQVVGAYLQDMGITSDYQVEEIDLTADHVPDPEVPSSTVQAVVHYIRALAPPRAAALSGVIAEGSAEFDRIGCATCHVRAFTTGTSVLAALGGQRAELYSDLLLHDMGDELADGRPDGQATGREWKTPPLWGLRLLRQFLNGDAFLMHDGRASTVDEAIRMHGGEGKAARDRYVALPDAQRAALLRFVETR